MTRTSSRISLLLAAIGICLLSGIAAASPVEVSIAVFHEQLAPHGRWVSEPSYGDVWIPSGVASGWEPYVDGEWEYTDYGWTWVSEDPWGDVPYHYGTWASVDPYGWVWVPGTVWGPAWVTWAYTDDYVGWAPVPPSLVLSARGYYGPAIVVPATRYIFVPAPRFVGVRVSTVRVPQTQSATIFTRASKTTRFEVSNGIVRAQGPPAARIERAMGHKLERVPSQRLRVQPTTLAAAGMTGSKSIRVVAPAAQGRTTEAGKTTEARKTTGASKAAPARHVSEPGHSGEKATGRSGEKAKAAKSSAPSETAKAAPKRAESHGRPASKPTPDHSGNPPKSSGANAHPPAEHKAKASSEPRDTAAHPPAEHKAKASSEPRDTAAHPPAEHRPPPSPPPARKSSEEPKPKDKQPPGTR